MIKKSTGYFITAPKQDFFNQYRENMIIEVVQALAKSEAGSQIAFKGGTASRQGYF